MGQGGGRGRTDDRTGKGAGYCDRRDMVQRNAGLTGQPVFLLGRIFGFLNAEHVKLKMILV